MFCTNRPPVARCLKHSRTVPTEYRLVPAQAFEVELVGPCPEIVPNARIRLERGAYLERTRTDGQAEPPASLTVLLEHPITPAIALIGICYAYSRRISSQPPTSNTHFLLMSAEARVTARVFACR